MKTIVIGIVRTMNKMARKYPKPSKGWDLNLSALIMAIIVLYIQFSDKFDDNTRVLSLLLFIMALGLMIKKSPTVVIDALARADI